MRNLVTVIDQILNVAPELEEHFNPLKESSMYAAPEMQPMWWNMVASALNEYAIDHPQADKIAVIFSGDY